MPSASPVTPDEHVNVGSDVPANCELFYTSAPRGLRPGSSGFCTVSMTSGMPPTLISRLESLSSYQPIFQRVANSVRLTAN